MRSSGAKFSEERNSAENHLFMAQSGRARAVLEATHHTLLYMLTYPILGAVVLLGELVTVTQQQPTAPHVDHTPNGEVRVMVVLNGHCSRLHAEGQGRVLASWRLPDRVGPTLRESRMYLPPWPVPNTLRTVLLVATPGCVRGWGSWRETHRTTRLVRASASAKHHSSYGSACLLALYLGQPSSAQEHRHRVTAGVGGDLL